MNVNRPANNEFAFPSYMITYTLKKNGVQSGKTPITYRVNP